MRWFDLRRAYETKDDYFSISIEKTNQVYKYLDSPNI